MYDLIIQAQLHREKLLREAYRAAENARLLRQTHPQKGTRFYYAMLARLGRNVTRWGGSREKRYPVAEKTCCTAKPCEPENPTA